MNEELFDDFIKNIFEATLTISSTEQAQEIFSVTFLELFKGVEEGWGTIEAPAIETIKMFEQNINIFSGAKTWKNIWDVQKQIFDENGMKRSFNDFRTIAKTIMTEYNVNWLQAEYQTAIAQARAAEYWNQIQAEKEDLPYLLYQTVGDDRVRPEHQVLDGIRKRVDDPFWQSYYPPNGFRCRCIVIQEDSGKETKISAERMKEIEDGIDDLFKFNSGTSGYIFNPEHPYLQSDGLPRPYIKEIFTKGKKDNFGFIKPETQLD